VLSGWIGVAASLSGCMSMSPGMQAVSFAGSGLSYEWTGKSLSDHALSFAVSKDCEFLRLIEARPLCRDTLPAAAAPLATAPQTTTTPPPLETIVLGRFRARRNAEAIAASYDVLDARVVEVPGASARWEVRAGPYSPTRSREVRAALVASGAAPFDVVASPNGAPAYAAAATPPPR